MKKLLIHLFALLLAATAPAQTTGLYTKSVPSATGGISGRATEPLTHAIALHRDRKQCFRADIAADGAFRFSGLPTGKYDLILITKAGAVFEGVALGESASSLTSVEKANLEKRVEKSDTFFNRWKIERLGLIEGGERALAFIERTRDKTILRQSGEQLMSNLRRFEVAEFTKAGDDWTLVETRHIYREEAPLGAGMAFFRHSQVPQLGDIRVIDSVKDIGSVTLPKP